MLATLPSEAAAELGSCESCEVEFTPSEYEAMHWSHDRTCPRFKNPDSSPELCRCGGRNVHESCCKECKPAKRG